MSLASISDKLSSSFPHSFATIAHGGGIIKMTEVLEADLGRRRNRFPPLDSESIFARFAIKMPHDHYSIVCVSNKSIDTAWRE